MRRTAVLLLCLAGAACRAQPTPAAREAEAARAVAMVEKAQRTHPPAEPLVLQPLAPADLRRAGLSAACGFRPYARPGPVLAIDGARGLVRLDGKPLVLAADTGSARLPIGTGHETYAGRAFELRVALSPSGGRTGVVTIRDAWNRLVYRAGGRLDCPA